MTTRYPASSLDGKVVMITGGLLAHMPGAAGRPSGAQADAG